MKRPLIFICSPYRGDVEANARNARRYCRFAISHRANRISPGVSGLRTPSGRVLTPTALASLGLHQQGGIPFAPHLLFTQFLDDSEKRERDAGIAMGTAMLALCDEVWVFDEPTTGMKLELAAAIRIDKPVRRFNKWCMEAAAYE